MVKTLISFFVVLFILVGSSIFERCFINKQFTELKEVFISLYDKVEDKTANEQDALSTQQNWLNKKKYLHAFIPHTEIKEIDLWLSESITYIGNEKWEDALSKMVVLIDLAEQIPMTFQLRWENIF